MSMVHSKTHAPTIHAAVCFALAALLTTVPADATPGAADGNAQLISASGKVFVQLPGGNEAAAQVGASLPPGTRIRTGESGSAKVRFADGSLLQVRPGTSLGLSAHKRKKEKKNSILLFFGRIWSKVTHSVTGEVDYEVTTPNAVCGVRGTQFETAVADDGSLRVRVSEGHVAVGEDGSQSTAAPGQEVDADENGVEPPATAEEKAKWALWEKHKRARLHSDAHAIVDKMKGKIMDRKARLEKLRAQQQQILAQRKTAEARLQQGDMGAVQTIKKYNQQLATIEDAIADIGDEATSQFAIVDHFADLANDKRFKMVDRQYLEAEAASLRRVKANLDKMVADGTNISMKAMDKMLEDMSHGKGSLKEKPGSAGDDLFGPDDELKMH